MNHRLIRLARRTTAWLGCAVLLASGALDASAQRQDEEAAPASARARTAHRCVRALPAGTTTITVNFRGASYPVRVHIPADVGSGKLPLVLDLHGSQSNGVVQAGISDLASVANQEKFIVVNPSGAIPLAQQDPPLPEGSWAWNVPGVPTTSGQFPPADARDDVAYLSALIAKLDRKLCVDDRRVYATGFSGGGRMASALACARPDLIAAVAPVAGLRAGRPSPVDTSVPELQSCAPSRPVPVITFHGDADLVNPYPGNADLRWGYSVSSSVQAWARLNDCRLGPEAQQVSENVTRFRYRHCRQQADVELYRVAGGGHTWPGTSVDLSPLGVTTQEIDASERAWQFFAAHPHAR